MLVDIFVKNDAETIFTTSKTPQTVRTVVKCVVWGNKIFSEAICLDISIKVLKKVAVGAIFSSVEDVRVDKFVHCHKIISVCDEIYRRPAQLARRSV